MMAREPGREPPVQTSRQDQAADLERDETRRSSRPHLEHEAVDLAESTAVSIDDLRIEDIVGQTHRQLDPISCSGKETSASTQASAITPRTKALLTRPLPWAPT